MALLKPIIKLYFTVAVVILININNESFAKNSCEVTREEGKIIDIKKSRENSPSTRALQGLNLIDELTCREKCCETEECTVYVFYKSKQRQYNCFLIRCHPTSGCIRSNLAGSVVGVMSRKDNDIHPSQVTTYKSKQGITLVTSISQTPINTGPTAMEQPEQRGVSPKPTAEHKNSSPSPSAIPSSVQSPTASTQVIHTPQKKTTTRKQVRTIDQASQHNHTNKVSLVIALFFGLLFLVAVLVIVGRPWWDFVQRPRYSKVDYLMNGL